MNGKLKKSTEIKQYKTSDFTNFVSIKNPRNEEENLILYVEISKFSSFSQHPPKIFDPLEEKFEDLSIGERKNSFKKMKKLKINGKDRYFAIK